MAKVNIPTQDGTCSVETGVSRASLSPNGLTWYAWGHAAGGGIAIQIQSYHASRSQARESAKGFIDGIREAIGTR